MADNNKGTTGTPSNTGGTTNTGRNEDQRNQTNKGGSGSDQQKQPMAGTGGANQRDDQRKQDQSATGRTPAYGTSEGTGIDSTRKPGQPGGSVDSKRPDHGTLEEEGSDLDRTTSEGDEGATDEGNTSSNKGAQGDR